MSGGSRFAFLVAGLWLTFSPPASADANTLRVGLFDMPPFYSKDSEGRPIGELITTLNQVMSRLNQKWEARFTNAPQALKGLVNGDLDLLMVIQHPMLRSKARYGRLPMARMDLMVFRHPDHPPVESLANLRGQRLALLRGYGYGGLVGPLMAPDNGVKLEVANNHNEAFQWLDQGKVGYVLDYRGPGEQAINRLELENIERDRLQEIAVYFVVSDKLTNGKTLLERMDAALEELEPMENP